MNVIADLLKAAISRCTWGEALFIHFSRLWQIFLLTILCMLQNSHGWKATQMHAMRSKFLACLPATNPSTDAHWRTPIRMRSVFEVICTTGRFVVAQTNPFRYRTSTNINVHNERYSYSSLIFLFPVHSIGERPHICKICSKGLYCIPENVLIVLEVNANSLI